jgi:hypothetical protein
MTSDPRPAGSTTAAQDVYILNHCTKFLARETTDARHNYDHLAPDDPRARICEPWRFPVIDSYSDGRDPVASYAYNRVTFVYAAERADAVPEVSVVGTFSGLYQPIPLRQVHFGEVPTRYLAVTAVVPKGELHFYKLLVDGTPTLDPINPQQGRMDNGELWSRFFTQFCTQRISFEKWEMEVLDRLTAHVLPFRTGEAEQFLDYYYNHLDRQAKESLLPRIYRFDESVGVSNFIDKLVSREEAHHLQDYKVCLRQIREVLRQERPRAEPGTAPREFYEDLYNRMAASGGPGENPIAGWDYGRYGSPRYFLQLLRRHTVTGAFSHPKYGGNTGAAGWAYLAETFKGADGESLFAWRRSIERPLGESVDYFG